MKQFKSLKMMALSGAALMLFSGGASAADLSGYYVGLSAGLSAPRDADVSESSVPFSGEADFDNSATFAVAVGKHVNDKVRAELEIGYRNTDYDLSIDGVPGSFDGDMKTWTALVNGYYDFMPDKRVSPYVGAGVGLARHKAEMTAGGVSSDDNDTVFAWQIGAGATADLTDKLDLQLGYRYLGTSDPDFDTISAEYGAHELRAGLMFNF